MTLIEQPWRAPQAVLAAFADEPFACGLISGGGQSWSYVMRQPSQNLVLDAQTPGEPFGLLRDLMGEGAQPHPDGPPFQGGVVALCAYELAARLEPSLDLGRMAAWPDLAAGRYQQLLAFDHRRRRVFAIGPDEAGAQAAASWLEAPSPAPNLGDLTDNFAPQSSDEDYEAGVEIIRGRIAAGDLFQANLARGWKGRLAAGASPFDLFMRLIEDSPAPFSAYLRLPGLALVSNSPERFLRLEDGLASTQPIKGTRPRGATPAADAALAVELEASEKDRAENLMIVDLMRNDLARVCAPGSVAAGPLYALESFANVHHLVSTVTGRLAPGRDGFDLMAAAFPPGSITGAPKIQAMKLIAQLEPPRGPYCGALMWAGFDGALDSSVLIRSVWFSEELGSWRFETRAGAGITAPSDPKAEAAETWDKIAAIQRALCGGEA